MTALTESGLLRLVGLIYEAATDASLWPVFLKAYAEALAGQITALQIHHFNEHRSQILAIFGIEPRFRKSYDDYYSNLNTWREQGRQKYVQGQALSCEALYPQCLLKRTEFYNDYLRPMGAVHCTSAVISRDVSSATTLTAMRSEGQDALAEAELRLAVLLLPHLMRANRIRQKFSVFDKTKTVLDNAPFAMLFLDSNGQCTYANRAAEDIFQRNDGLILRSGRLHAVGSHTDAALERALHQALSPVRSIACREAVVVERTSTQRPYEVIIAPTSERFSGLIEKANAIVMISDPTRRFPVENTILKQLYGLTSKEADVANKLSEGKSIQEIAHDLKIRYETARTHLRRIFSKTGTSRQSELVLFLGRIPPRPLGK